jgi:hypothetical protein
LEVRESWKKQGEKQSWSGGRVMTTSFRPFAIFVELVIIVAAMYSLFMGMNLGLVDLGLDRKYLKFLKIIAILMSCLILFFLVSHLIAFYPSLLTLSPSNG